MNLFMLFCVTKIRDIDYLFLFALIYFVLFFCYERRET